MIRYLKTRLYCTRCLHKVINKPYAECAACGGTGVVCGGKDGAK